MARSVQELAKCHMPRLLGAPRQLPMWIANPLGLNNLLLKNVFEI